VMGQGLPGKRNSAEARRVANEAYPYRCCVVCGLSDICLDVAHLDNCSWNNDPDNLAFLCPTHHSMYDRALYPLEAIKLLRAHWQETKGTPSHKARMKDAGVKAARRRKWRLAGLKAAATRRARQTADTRGKSTK
jgi:hypothetical protein